MAREVKSVEERIKILDDKITKKKAEIEKLEEQKHQLLHPVSMRDVLSKAKDAGYSPKEVADKLGLKME